MVRFAGNLHAAGHRFWLERPAGARLAVRLYVKQLEESEEARGLMAQMPEWASPAAGARAALAGDACMAWRAVRGGLPAGGRLRGRCPRAGLSCCILPRRSSDAVVCYQSSWEF